MAAMAKYSALPRRCGTPTPANKAKRSPMTGSGGTRMVGDTGGSQASARVVLIGSAWCPRQAISKDGLDQEV